MLQAASLAPSMTCFALRATPLAPFLAPFNTLPQKPLHMQQHSCQKSTKMCKLVMCTFRLCEAQVASPAHYRNTALLRAENVLRRNLPRLRSQHHHCAILLHYFRKVTNIMHRCQRCQTGRPRANNNTCSKLLTSSSWGLQQAALHHSAMP